MANIDINNEYVIEDLTAAQNMLGAFKNQVYGKKIKPNDANILIQDTNQIIKDIETTKTNI